MKFQVGDRVAVYGSRGRFVGKVLYVNAEGAVWVEYGREPNFGGGYGPAGTIGGLVHPKQCRRLKKKPARRRVWIRYVTGPGGAQIPCAYGVENGGIDCVEFIEVRRPRGK